MKALRNAAIGLGLLLVAALLGAWLVPPMLDWNQYRGAIATLMSNRLGHPVQIDGAVKLSLLPQPYLTAERISMAATDSGVSLSVAALRLRLALGPLLAGRIDAREIVLREPDLHLPWPLSAIVTKPADIRAPTWLSAVSARVEGGRLSVAGIAITGIAITGIDATLGTQADTGSYVAAGTAQISGQSWHMTARLTQPGADDAVGLDFTLDGRGKVQGLGAVFSGQIGADGTVTGRIGGGGPDMSRVLPAPVVAFRADGRLNIAGGLAVADELSVDIAGSPATGAVSLQLSPVSRLDVSLAASRLDLDAWLPVWLHATGDAAALPAGIPMGVDLSVEAGTLAGGTLRALRGSVDMDGVTTRLRNVAVILPGDTRLKLDGVITRRDGGTPPGTPHLDGHATIDAPNLRTTLAWLDAARAASSQASFGTNLPEGVLRTAELRARFEIDASAVPQIALTELDGTLDGSHVQGTAALAPAGRMGVQGNLHLDRLDLDPWLTGNPPSLASASARLGPFDLDLQVGADQARWHGHSFAPLTLDVMAGPGKMMVRRLAATSAGVGMVARGAIGEDGRLSDGRLDIDIAAGQAAPALLAWRPDLGGFAAHLPAGAASVAVSAAGPPEALGMQISAAFGDVHFEARPLLDLVANRWSSTLALHHPGAPRLLETLAIPGTVAWLGDGSLSLLATLSGSSGHVALDNFDLTAGSLRASGVLALDRQGETSRLIGHVSAETLPLPLPYLHAPDPLPLSGLSMWQASVKIEARHVLFGQSPALDQTSALLTLENGLVKLQGIKAVLSAGTLTGAASFDNSAKPPALLLDMALAGAELNGPVFELPIDLTGGTVDATAHLSASGYAPSTLLATLSGDVHVTARDGTLAAIDLGRALPGLAEPDLRMALSGGNTGFTLLDLTASLQNGAMSISRSSLTGPAGSGILSGLIDVAAGTADLRLTLRPAVNDPPEIGVRFSGALSDPVRTLETADVLAWRVRHP